jgi:hypothetical protein
MSRSLAFCLTALSFSAAFADRVVSMPSAYAIQKGEAKAEILAFGKDLQFGWIRLDAQVAPFVEVQAFASRLPDQRQAVSLNAQYTIIQPFADLMPGLSVGIFDVTNETEIGRSLYVAATFVSNIYSDWAEAERISLTIGGGIGGMRRGLFVGLQVPMFRHVEFIGEYDTKRITAGIDIEAAPNIGARILFRGGQPMLGLQFRRLF